MEPAAVLQRDRLRKVAEPEACRDDGLDAVVRDELEYVGYRALVGIIAVEARQENAVGYLGDGVEALEQLRAAQDARVADDAAASHGLERVAQGGGGDELEGLVGTDALFGQVPVVDERPIASQAHQQLEPLLMARRRDRAASGGVADLNRGIAERARAPAPLGSNLSCKLMSIHETLCKM